MTQTCKHCARANPPEARYCYYDGIALAGLGNGAPVHVGTVRFPTPFVFPSGRVCHNFDELAQVCQDDWSGILKALSQGDLTRFFDRIGRPDLAQVALEAGSMRDRLRGLDKLLEALPSEVIQPARLYAEPMEINLSGLHVGEDRRLELHLVNSGMRLLSGSVTCEDCVWLSLQDSAAVREKVFEFPSKLVLPVYIQGKYLGAHPKPREGRLVIESNGGTATILVRATVPVVAFPHGVLAGATSPRQLAEKARARPREAAEFFESGAVAQWYRDNGWRYPVHGPSSSGLAAVQQFFEALGLSKPPRVEVSQAQVQLHGEPGEVVRQSIEVRTREDRAVYATAKSNQPWLMVECGPPKGRVAPIWLIVNPVPDSPGETLNARVALRANGNQRFVVPVSLTVGGRVRVPVAAEADPFVFDVEPVRASTPAKLPPKPKSPWRRHLVPAYLLLVPLVVMFVRDVFYTGVAPPLKETEEEIGLLDPDPRIQLRFLDHEITLYRTSGGGMKDNRGEAIGPNLTWEPSMRFGVTMSDPHNPGESKFLTFRGNGITNNTCLRLDGRKEVLFGETPLKGKGGERVDALEDYDGHWKEREAELGTDPSGRKRIGRQSVWLCDAEKLQITQIVEVVPGSQTRLLDTCLVRYVIENQDRRAHRVGLRFLLDTYIGSNDGVPFNLPGKEMCDTKRSFDRPEDVPDYIEALEYQDLGDPGTVAFLQLKVGGKLESPGRVTLGAYPDPRLDVRDANQQFTLWKVPVLSMRSLNPADSAVVMYWPERNLEPGETREVGFAYGLGKVANTEGGGKLAVTAGGRFVAGEEFTVTAYVKEPVPNQRLTLRLPDGLELKDETESKPVPPLVPGSTSLNSTVSWRVHAAAAGKFELKVESSTGAQQSYPVRIAPSIFLK